MATQLQCERALDLFELELSRRKNVVGLGIVPAEEDEPRAGRDNLVVAVYVRRKVPADRLPEKERVPESLPVPGRNGPILVPTRVIEQDEVRAETGEKEIL